MKSFQLIIVQVNVLYNLFFMKSNRKKKRANNNKLQNVLH